MYTVITATGFVHVFHIREMVDIYLAAYGGVVIMEQSPTTSVVITDSACQ